MGSQAATGTAVAPHLRVAKATAQGTGVHRPHDIGLRLGGVQPLCRQVLDAREGSLLLSELVVELIWASKAFDLQISLTFLQQLARDQQQAGPKARHKLLSAFKWDLS